jgi:hypothetical protein
MHEFQNDVLNAKWISRPFVTEKLIVRPTLEKDRFNCRQFSDLQERGVFLEEYLCQNQTVPIQSAGRKGQGWGRSNVVCFARVIFLIEIM